MRKALVSLFGSTCVLMLPFWSLANDQAPRSRQLPENSPHLQFGTGGVGTDTHPPANSDLPRVHVTADGITVMTKVSTIKVPSGNEMVDRFFFLWWDLHNPANGYFSKLDIPFHSAETLLVEAPDFGHLTTSEGFSYWVWLEAMFGRYTGDYSLLSYSMEQIEKYAIPSFQSNIGAYQPQSPATYARENPQPELYPSPLEPNVKPGIDPIGNELKAAYGDPIYGMHWLIDTRNWYGYGTGESPTFINTFQRGRQESVWETVPHPSIDELQFGAPSQGFLSLFTQDTNGYKKQWRYTNAPDADARLIQAIFWAKRYIEEQGQQFDLTPLINKASKMGDYLRYAMFDKYFKSIGCQSIYCEAGKGYESAHFLLSWYYAWGGSHPSDFGGWSWRIGSSHAHFGYQNPMAAFALSQDPSFQMKTPRGELDWQISLNRQVEFYRWLQSNEGAIAGGATNSVNGRYDQAPKDTSKFYGLSFENDPVYADPASNSWFGWQAWSMQRIAEYYAVTGDKNVEVLLDRWVNWALSHIKFDKQGGFLIPVTLEWSGQPYEWNPLYPQVNTQLKVRVTEYNQDVGIASALAKTLMFYAKGSATHRSQKQSSAIQSAKELLDRIWTQGRDPLGLSFEEVRKDYSRFSDPVFIPETFQGKMPSQAQVRKGSTFLSLRPQYKTDPEFAKIQRFLEGGEPPRFRYHRFWAQVEAALAFAEFDRLALD